VSVRVESVRPGDEGALEAFRRLLLAYNEELPADLRFPDHAAEARELRERYPVASSAMLLAYADEGPVGCVVVRRLDDASAEIKRLFVAPSARGTGAGRALTQAAIGYARERGFARIVLDTHRDRLAPAYGLYRSLGFVACDAYAEAEYACPTFMELRLT